MTEAQSRITNEQAAKMKTLITSMGSEVGRLQVLQVQVLSR